MERKELEGLQDSAADSALKARQRIEAAVDAGELPVWVLDACEVWEKSALMYGAARAKLAQPPQRPLMEMPGSQLRH
jgi:hypothetical protein